MEGESAAQGDQGRQEKRRGIKTSGVEKDG